MRCLMGSQWSCCRTVRELQSIMNFVSGPSNNCNWCIYVVYSVLINRTEQLCVMTSCCDVVSLRVEEARFVESVYNRVMRVTDR